MRVGPVGPIRGGCRRPMTVCSCSILVIQPSEVYARGLRRTSNAISLGRWSRTIVTRGGFMGGEWIPG